MLAGADRAGRRRRREMLLEPLRRMGDDRLHRAGLRKQVRRTGNDLKGFRRTQP